ncbi:putative magnesium transporter MRS2 [Helianthus debilis subsp. tardiflorus]
MIQLELFLLSGTVSLSVYSLVAAIFGMNIPYPWNKNHGYMFKWVCMSPLSLCASILNKCTKDVNKCFFLKVIMFAAMVSASVFMSITTYSRHKGLVGS